MSTRAGGVSRGALAELNLGTAVGDDADAVAENRRRFARALGGVPIFLSQVHGTRVVRLGAAEAEAAREGAAAIEADACFTTEGGIACVVQIADCLPVLLAAPGQRGVAAAHAGWRGLSAGVLEACATELASASRCELRELQAWLGPCIGPRQFEVGADVLAGFGVDSGQAHPRFVARPQEPGKWLADLAGLAADRLTALGLTTVQADGSCTVEDDSRFFSFRRDRPGFGNSGRLAAAIWIDRRAGR
ncbi:peptidoglycan editing factor PgeF [Rivibacter subsaxonicus]|nr:peptidoglycan editing factor PgeF [Rivibacter subsaxonicus]